MFKSALEQRPVCAWTKHSWLFIQYIVLYQPASNQTAPNSITKIDECMKCARIRLTPMVEDGLTDG